MSGSAPSSAPQSVARIPRARILVGGNPLVNAPISFSVDSDSFYHADKFTASLALQGEDMFGLSWWANNTGIIASVQVGFQGYGESPDAIDWQYLFTGKVDVVDIDLRENKVEISGRDLLSLLIDAKTSETFANQKSSDVAITLAERHGLSASVTPTQVVVGQYYQLEHDRITLNNTANTTTEFDLLVKLAKFEGFLLWVSPDGTTLHFEAPENNPPFLLDWQPPNPQQPVPQGNFVDIKLHRDLSLARDIKVTVLSTQLRTGKPLKVSVTGTTGGGGRGNSGQAAGSKSAVAEYTYVKPNLDRATAQQYAQNMLKQITLLERKLHIDMPGDFSLTARDMLTLQNTNTSFDQDYFIGNLHREMAFGSFRQHVEARNTSPRVIESE